MAWVVAPSNELVLHWRDDRGKHSTTRFFISSSETDPSSGAAAAISSTAAPLSNSALYETEILIVAEQDTPATFGTSPYDRPSDKVQYEFNAADGSITHLQIGAPLDNQFLDKWNVDFSLTPVSNLVAAIKTNTVTQEGKAILTHGQAHRRRPPRRKIQ